MSDEPRVVTFKEKYNEPQLTWQEKAVLIALYHSAMCMKFKDWTQQDTADHFGISVGLVSENIRLAKAIDSKELSVRLMKLSTREAGLKLIDRRKFQRMDYEE